MPSPEDQEGPSGQPDASMADPPPPPTISPPSPPSAALAPPIQLSATTTATPQAPSKAEPAPEAVVDAPPAADTASAHVDAPKPESTLPAATTTQDAPQEAQQKPVDSLLQAPTDTQTENENTAASQPVPGTATEPTAVLTAQDENAPSSAPSATANNAALADIGAVAAVNGSLSWNDPSLWTKPDGTNPAANSEYYDALARSDAVPLYSDLLAQSTQSFLPMSMTDMSPMANYAFADVGTGAVQGFPFPADQEDDDEEEEYEHPPNVYGKLEFPDSTTWITTKTILIGRDQKIFLQARKERAYRLKVEEHLARGLPAPDPPRATGPSSRGRHHPKSFVSEEGGALGPESDGDDNPRPSKRRRTAAGERAVQQTQKPPTRGGGSNIISSRQYLDYAPGPGDVGNLNSQDEIAEVRIHGEGPDMWASTKGISRSHLKITYDPKERVWKGMVLGRNGVFCRSIHHKEGDVFVLYSGDELQIQYITMQFYLTGVEDGKTGAEIESAPVSRTYSENGKEMSFDFQSSRGDEMHDTDDSSDQGEDEPANAEAVQSDDSDDSDEAMEDAPTPERATTGEASNIDGEDEIRETVESDPIDGSLKPEFSPDEVDRLASLPLPPKKRGPGRPPKNGIMSKREERLLKKQAQEEAKRNMPPQEPGDQPQKRKVGRPRKHPLPEGADGLAEKRKYKPRKPKGEDGEDELDGDKPAKEKSMKHKTPPLELRREDFTEEQLQKPTKNYQLLIDEIMTAAPPKGYSLKQVYKRIQERWPYFYFCVDTKGWESSVRHNLLGSECFKKIEGNWHRVPGVPLESGKKRKPSDSIAEPRPAGMYNGYSHPYQSPTHGQHHVHHPPAHSTGLTPNLPPRYPPNGQAYQIHQGPPPNAVQPGMAVVNPQGPPRPGYPQQHQTPGVAPQQQANGYAAAGVPPRPQHVGVAAPPYASAYGNRPPQPQQTHMAHQGPAVGPGAVNRPPVARPGPGPPLRPQHNAPAPQHMNAMPNVPRPVVPPAHPHHHQQPPPAQNNVPAAPLGPVIEPLLKFFIREFRAEVIKQLHAKEGKRSEAVAMSVINRGLGLTDRSLVPDLEPYEKLILNVFRQHKQIYPKRRAEEAAKAAAAAAANQVKAGVNGSAQTNPHAGGVVGPIAAPAASMHAHPPRPAISTSTGTGAPVTKYQAATATPMSLPRAAGGTSVAGNPSPVPIGPPTNKPVDQKPLPTASSSTAPISATAGSITPVSAPSAAPVENKVHVPPKAAPETSSIHGLTASATSVASVPASKPAVPTAQSQPAAAPLTNSSTTIGTKETENAAGPKPVAASPKSSAARPDSSIKPHTALAVPAPSSAAHTTAATALPATSTTPTITTAGTNTATLPKPVTPMQNASTSSQPASSAPRPAEVVKTTFPTPNAAPAPVPSIPAPSVAAAKPSTPVASTTSPGLVTAKAGPIPSVSNVATGAGQKPTSTNPQLAASATIPAPTAQTAAVSSSAAASQTSGTNTSVPPRPATTAAPWAGSSSAPSTSNTNATAAPAPPRSAGPTSVSSTNPQAARAKSATPGTPATPDTTKEVELLDPKLVNVILSFKKSILPTLAEKLDPLLGESLIMSAVDRVLGFTDDTFVQSKSEQQKQHFAEAEKALMKHLETRFGEYVRNRSAQR